MRRSKREGLTKFGFVNESSGEELKKECDRERKKPLTGRNSIELTYEESVEGGATMHASTWFVS